MKRYDVKSAAGSHAVMDVLSQGAHGYQVRITRSYETWDESIEEFMSRELFESLLRTGYIRERSSLEHHEVA